MTLNTRGTDAFLELILFVSIIFSHDLFGFEFIYYFDALHRNVSSYQYLLSSLSWSSGLFPYQTCCSVQLLGRYLGERCFSSLNTVFYDTGRCQRLELDFDVEVVLVGFLWRKTRLPILFLL